MKKETVIYTYVYIVQYIYTVGRIYIIKAKLKKQKSIYYSNCNFYNIPTFQGNQDDIRIQTLPDDGLFRM